MPCRTANNFYTLKATDFDKRHRPRTSFLVLFSFSKKRKLLHSIFSNHRIKYGTTLLNKLPTNGLRPTIFNTTQQCIAPLCASSRYLFHRFTGNHYVQIHLFQCFHYFNVFCSPAMNIPNCTLYRSICVLLLFCISLTGA